MERCTIGCPPWFPCAGCACMIPRLAEASERERRYTGHAGFRNGFSKAIPPYKEKKYTQLSLDL